MILWQVVSAANRVGLLPYSPFAIILSRTYACYKYLDLSYLQGSVDGWKEPERVKRLWFRADVYIVYYLFPL